MMGHRRDRTRVILLGTNGGPVWARKSPQGTSAVVVVEDAAYMVDCGDGTGRQWMRAELGGPEANSDFARLRAMFLTHLHTDHIVGLPAVVLFGTRSLQASGMPVRVFGPGPRGVLPKVQPPGRPVPPVVAPGNPTPGTEELVESIFQAYANDINVRIRHEGSQTPRDGVLAQDIVLPPGVGDDPNLKPVPTLPAPIEIYEDDLVRVTATLADHGGMFPSFAFRFDTSNGSIVFSGDTTVHPNITTLARNVDLLVHEVVDEKWAQDFSASLPPAERDALLAHLVGSHTTIEQVGCVAEDAGARTLLLYHLVPGDNPRKRWKGAQRCYSGKLIVGRDLMQVGVRSHRRKEVSHGL